MANRLKKLADARYTPGSPGQPYVPAYCTQRAYTVAGYYPFYTKWIKDDNGEWFALYSTGPYVPAHTEYRTVCYPARPYIAPVPPTSTYTAILGWNGGARSIGQIDLDGNVTFQVNSAPSAVVVGLSNRDLTTLPSEPSHALYFHSSVVDVMEYGEVVHTAPISHTYSNVYKIGRVGQTVTYSSGAWSYTSALPSVGGVFVDAALYASGDFVDNPVLTNTVATGAAGGSFKALYGHAYEGAYAEAYGSLLALSGGAVQYAAPVTAAGTMKALAGVAYEGDYTYGGGAMIPLEGAANGGYPQVSLIYMTGTMSSLIGAAVGYTGEVGQAVGSLAPLAGLASEGAYGEVRGTLPMFIGYADSGWPIPNEKFVSEGLVLGDQYFPDAREYGSWSETLTFDDEYVSSLSVEGSYYDTLLLDDTLTATQALEVVMMEALRLGDDLSGVLRLDLPGGLTAGEPMQYAVNVLTGAITTYSGFGFTGFARSGQQLYACKPDGVYWVRPGDDAGQPRQGFIDFGASDFGSTGIKSVESVYLGIQTDGQLVLRLKDDAGTERLYRVIQRSPMMRALTAKGVGARKWNVALEIIDATEFELDTLEVQVGISRRWVGR